KGDQVIVFGSITSRNFGDADFLLNATASSNLAVQFATSGQCSVNGNTVHLNSAGSCTITASQPGNGDYNAAAEVNQAFGIASANQTITFAALSGKTLGDTDFAVNATASSGLSTAFSASGQCTINGALV